MKSGIKKVIWIAAAIFLLIGAVLIVLSPAFIHEDINRNPQPLLTAIQLASVPGDRSLREHQCHEYHAETKTMSLRRCADVLSTAEVKDADACSMIALILGCRYFAMDDRALRQPGLLEQVSLALQSPCTFGTNEDALRHYFEVKTGRSERYGLRPSNYFCGSGVSELMVVFVRYDGRQVARLSVKPIKRDLP